MLYIYVCIDTDNDKISIDWWTAMSEYGIIISIISNNTLASVSNCWWWWLLLDDELYWYRYWYSRLLLIGDMGSSKNLFPNFCDIYCYIRTYVNDGICKVIVPVDNCSDSRTGIEKDCGIMIQHNFDDTETTSTNEIYLLEAILPTWNNKPKIIFQFCTKIWQQQKSHVHNHWIIYVQHGNYFLSSFKVNSKLHRKKFRNRLSTQELSNNKKISLYHLYWFSRRNKKKVPTMNEVGNIFFVGDKVSEGL